MQAIDLADLHARSARACQRLAETEAFRHAEALMLFLPMKHEVDATPLAIRAWQLGKTVTVPLVSYAQRHMIPVEIRSLSDPVTVDERGIQSPRNGVPIPVDLIDLVVVPGLGFDTTGHRIGRGAGFYDRFLSQPNFGGTICGLALDDQVVPEVPTQKHDVPLHMLVTDRRTVRFASAPK